VWLGSYIKLTYYIGTRNSILLLQCMANDRDIIKTWYCYNIMVYNDKRDTMYTYIYIYVIIMIGSKVYLGYDILEV
jgi:hypothetical protein